MRRKKRIVWQLCCFWFVLLVGCEEAITPTAAIATVVATAEPLSSPTTLPLMPSANPNRILIGTEYILLDRPNRIQPLAELLSPLNLTTAKPLAEHTQWDKMQPSADAPINFAPLDRFVRHFQATGFTDLVLALRSLNSWASVAPPDNPTPKPEQVAAYENWVFAIVERYDNDGVDDMPNLRYPIRFYEIGSEFSSYEPEPVADYLVMLEHAYTAAHRAYDDVQVTHAAFLTTNAFRTNPSAADYPTAFTAVPDQTHSLADIRQILDRPDLFDVVNLHSLGDPYEIEAMVAWLQFEMTQRDYHKPLILSDTATSPFIAWGAATNCELPAAWMGQVVAPATEADRCRLADYFTALIEEDAETLAWVQAYAAEDTVKKVVIAAEQGIWLINTSFLEDLIWLKLPLALAGAGNSAWAGLVDLDKQELRAGYHALQQLTTHLGNYDTIRRLPSAEEGVRIYAITEGATTRWIAWYDSGALVLPTDPMPTTTLNLTVDAASVTAEKMVIQAGDVQPERTQLVSDNGVIVLTLDARPIFIAAD